MLQLILIVSSRNLHLSYLDLDLLRNYFDQFDIEDLRDACAGQKLKVVEVFHSFYF